MMFYCGPYEETYTSTGKLSGYRVRVKHTGLNEYKYLSARDKDVLEGKIDNQKKNWENKWQRHLERLEKEKELQAKLECEQLAGEKTKQAKESIQQIENILLYTLDIDDAVDWDSIKNTTPFKIENLKHEFLIFREYDGYPLGATKLDIPFMPEKIDYIKSIPFFKMIIGQRGKIRAEQETQFYKATKAWEKEKSAIEEENAKRDKAVIVVQDRWEAEKKKYEDKQAAFNQKVEFLKKSYEDKNADAIKEYCEIVLNNSEYPDSFPKDFDLQYNPENKMLLVDYQLPCLNDIPKLNVVKYVKSRDDYEIKYLSESAHCKLFDSAIYQIALRTIHELFEADVINEISAVNFNGIVTDVNPATGHEESKCIISVQAQKEPFLQINLAQVDPKQCFKSLKGVGSSKLSSMTAVSPIMEIDKRDRRFVEHYAVASEIDDTCNLAAMGWEDFEHLVREIFEKEFVEQGGEVKVTRASSDGGVDAIAFDPDPIRGGKIVIQAKRYTNTVGVSAVRDLYGTVMSEGATKGILVTTADYGPDSYEFAKGKPLTLLNGSNLLFLLEKHGHKAKIDIKEAKKILKDKV